jgi:hypothetical protein
MNGNWVNREEAKANFCVWCDMSFASGSGMIKKGGGEWRGDDCE